MKITSGLSKQHIFLLKSLMVHHKSLSLIERIVLFIDEMIYGLWSGFPFCCTYFYASASLCNFTGGPLGKSALYSIKTDEDCKHQKENPVQCPSCVRKRKHLVPKLNGYPPFVPLRWRNYAHTVRGKYMCVLRPWSKKELEKINQAITSQSSLNLLCLYRNSIEIVSFTPSHFGGLDNNNIHGVKGNGKSGFFWAHQIIGIID